MAPERVYWDTSCFISYLSGTHPEEIERSKICEAVLQEARNGDIAIWTSVWTIAETIRPKALHHTLPLPEWATLLDQKDSRGISRYPNATKHLESLWVYHQKNTIPSRLLPEDQALKIRQMFDWPWIHLIQVDPVLATRATEIARAHRMKPADALHVASAISKGCRKLHRWDRDYARTDSLIISSDPERKTFQHSLNLDI